MDVVEQGERRTLGILHLEDDPADAALVAAFLDESDTQCRIVHVRSRAEYEAALRDEAFDLVISDYSLPGYDGLHALRALQEVRPGIPFVLLSGKVGEETAVDCIKAGASDYVLKDRLARLPVAIVRALRDAEFAVQQRQMERELQSTQERFRRIAEQSVAAIVLIENGHVTFANKYCAELTGHDIEEFLDMPARGLLRLIWPTHQERVRRLVLDIQQLPVDTPSHIVIRSTVRDGSDLWLQVSLVRFVLAGQNAVIAMAVDVTRLKAAEQENSVWAAAVRHAAEGFEVTDADGMIQFVNPAMAQQSGYSVEELIGERASFVKSGEHSHSFYADMWSTIKSGRIWSGTFINRRKDGSKYRVQTAIAPIYDEMGEINKFLAVKRDTTQQEMLEQQLRQAQKMEAIGTLAGGIAHDFNNILAAMMGYAELASLHAAHGSELERDLMRVLEAGKRAKELIRQLLTFSRKGEQENIIFDLRTVFKETARLLKAAIPANVEIHLHYGEEPMTVRGDATQLHQLMLNLCSNARDAIGEEQGRIDMRLTQFIAEPHLQKVGIVPGRYVLLSVADTGCGMSHETVARAFEPFFTTKQADRGTGMGLAIAHGVVKAHGGVMTIYSELGVGTECKVYLPYADESGEANIVAAEDPPRGSERVLVVDDEEWLVEYFTRVLSELGYAVTGTTHSTEAWELFTENPHQFDLVITDQTMPKMTGRQLIAKVKAVRPDQPVIVLSGFSERFTSEAAYELGVSAYLNKPVDRLELAETVRAVIDTAAGEKAGEA